ncbi:MAG: SAM-dependent methyltransferase [Acidimicrobiales bacterium]
MDGVAATSLMTAAARARESARPDRLLNDPWAELLAGEEGRAFLGRQDHVLPPTPVFAIRHRFFDDFLLTEAHRGVRQIVLLAAGLDTRAYRLAWPVGVRLYELDQPQVLEYKQSTLDGAAASPTCERIVVATDLREDWVEKLLAAGYDRSEPAVWLAEGLLFYLPEASVRSLLDITASLSARGSALGTDTMSAVMLASEERKPWVELYRECGAPFVFGTDEPAELLASHGWVPTVYSSRSIAEGFGRVWPTPVAQGLPPGSIITATRTP